MSKFINVDGGCLYVFPESKLQGLGMVTDQIEGNPHQPGADAAIAAKLMSGVVRLEEAILGN